MAKNAKQIPNIENYKAVDVLALAIDVYKQQGFIRSGEGYSKIQDDDSVIETKDNKTLVLDAIKENMKAVDSSQNEAQTIMDKFNGRFMLKKLQGGLTNFEKSVSESFLTPILNNFNVSVIASIPHMNEIDKKRQVIRDKIEDLRFKSEFFGELRKRYDLTVDVLDVKFIQSTGVYMITAVREDKDIIKFWWRDQPDISDIIDGKTINIRGTVHKHEDSKYSNAKETMVNRVKIIST